MALFESKNPAFGENVFRKTFADVSNESMTVKGTVNKTMILLLLAVLGASFTWQKIAEAVNPAGVQGWLFGGLIVGFAFSLITIFRPKSAPWSAPLYALSEGVFLGGISAFLNLSYPGIVMNAVVLTFGVMFLMLLIYRTGWIKVDNKFKTGLLIATGAIGLFYVVIMVLNMFRVSTPFMYDTSLLGVGINLLIVAVAAANLLMDFDFIEKGSQSGAPKFMEWYGAFGLMVTLVWLYIELLRLLARFAGRRS